LAAGRGTERYGGRDVARDAAWEVVAGLAAGRGAERYAG